jgi:hypothetical protein
VTGPVVERDRANPEGGPQLTGNGGPLRGRRPGPSDGRRAVTSVTDAGKQALRDKRSARTEQLAEALSGGFTRAELRALMAAGPLIERLGESICLMPPSGTTLGATIGANQIGTASGMSGTFGGDFRRGLSAGTFGGDPSHAPTSVPDAPTGATSSTLGRPSVPRRAPTTRAPTTRAPTTVTSGWH